MGRPVVLSNGKLFVGLNEDGLVHDFYFPYVGLNNLTTARSTSHKIGVWVDGRFRWVDDGSWNISIDFERTALVSKISMHSAELQISLRFADFVDIEDSAFIRRIEVTNHAEGRRDVRLFMHQVFEISSSGRGDTALYEPDDHYVVAYKGRRWLLASGKLDETASFDQFAVGNYGIEGKSGTFLDSEDGELSGNLVEHGGVDSVLRFRRELDGQESMQVDYWVVAADSQEEAEKVHRNLRASALGQKLQETREHYQVWLEPANKYLQKMPEPYKMAASKSLLVMKAHCDNQGSILASGDSSIFNYGRDYYCYCWPRDAVYVLWPMVRVGLFNEAKKFFDFAAGTIHKDGYMHHKYQPDRAVGSTWHARLQHGKPELAIQEDETACIPFLLWEYYQSSHDLETLENYYESLVLPTATFMTRFVDEQTGLPHASFDLWEEKFLTSTYTVSMVIAGLTASAKIAHILGDAERSHAWQAAAQEFRNNLGALFHPDGYFRKGFYVSEEGHLEFDDVVDISSLQGIYMLAGLLEGDKRLLSTVKHVETTIFNSTPTGGVVRYQQDNYFRHKPQYGGNPWIVGTMWLAQYYIGIGNHTKAEELVNWAVDRMTASGLLGEQFDPETGESVGVLPLVWSHAEFVNTLLDLYP